MEDHTSQSDQSPEIDANQPELAAQEERKAETLHQLWQYVPHLSAALLAFYAPNADWIDLIFMDSSRPRHY